MTRNYGRGLVTRHRAWHFRVQPEVFHREWRPLLLLFVSLWGLYLYTAPRDILLEDDGLFVLGSYFLGIVHPPGYPLHTLLGKLFTLVPVNSVAYRVHAMSGFFGALTCVVTWLAVRRLIPGRIPAYTAAIALGVSQVFWSQAIIAEVYTLNSFFFFLLTWLVLRETEGGKACLTPSTSWLIWTGLVFGLSLSNHWPLMLLSAPALVLFAWPRLPDVLRRLYLVLPALLLGLTPYLWLWVRARMDLPISFYGPLENWEEFWHMVTRRGYRHVDQSVSANLLDKLEFGRFLAQQMASQFTYPGGILVLVGFVAQWRVWRPSLSIGLTFCFLANTLLLLLLLGFDFGPMFQAVFRVYPMVAYGIMAIWLSLGLYALGTMAGRFQRPVMLMGLGIPVLLLVINMPSNDRQGYRWASEYAKAVLESLEPDSILLITGDYSLPIVYKHMVEGIRPDVTLYSRQGLVLDNRLFKPIAKSLRDSDKAIKRLFDESDRPFYFAFKPTWKRPFVQDNWLTYRVFREESESLPFLRLNPIALEFAEKLARTGWQDDHWSANQRSGLSYSLGYLLIYAECFPSRSHLDRTVQALRSLLKEHPYGRLGILQAGTEFRRRCRTDLGLEQEFNQVETLLNRQNSEKKVLATLYDIKGTWQHEQGQTLAALNSYARALAIWEHHQNPAVEHMLSIYAATGDKKAFIDLRDKIYRGRKIPARIDKLLEQVRLKAGES